MPDSAPLTSLTESRVDASRRRLLMQLYRQGEITQLYGIVVVGITLYVLWDRIDHSLLLAWGIWFCALLAVRMAIGRRFLNNADTITDIRPWAYGALIGIILGGLSWGTLGLAYDFQWPTTHQVYILLLFAGLSSVSSAAYAPSLRAHMFFVGCLLTPIMLKFASHGTSSSYVMAFLVFGYLTCMYFIGLFTNRSVVSNTNLRLANDNLIQNLSRKNTELRAQIKQRGLVEKELRRERLLFVNGPVLVFRWRAVEGWPIEYVSPNVSQFGWNAGDLMNEHTDFAELVHPDDLPKVIASKSIEYPHTGPELIELDYRLVMPNGEVRWVYDRGMPVKNPDGRLIYFEGYLVDITDRKRAEQSLFEEKERVQVTLHSIGDGVITTDVHNRVTYMNPVAESMTGVKLRSGKGRKLEDVIRATDQTSNRRIRDLTQHWRRRDQDENMHSVRLRSDTDSMYDIAYSMAPIQDHGSDTMGSVVVLRDATQILALTRELAYFASHDALTNALNRREFERCVEAALNSAAQKDITHALLYIDIDRFKIINDTCGHRAGDELLRRVSDLLAKNLRQYDVIARLGGDEFAILLQRCRLDQAQIIAEKLRRATFSTRFHWNDQVFEIGISIGIAEIDKNAESPSEIMSAADMACYTAKDLGRDRVHVYEESDSELITRRTEMHWVSRINNAIEDNRLVLYAQDIKPVAQDADDIHRVEILARLYDEDGSVVSARTFLPAIERYGLITTLDRWVIRNSFDTIKHMENAGNTIFAINISGSSLGQDGFLDYVKSQFEAFEVKGPQICFEITETAAVSHFRNAHMLISELKAFGCYFALDDFGSGLSSFGYLKDLSVDFLKIDGRFVQNIVNDTVDRALVAAINDVGHVMLIDTIAEHVENQATVDEIREIGIDYAQGSFIGNPKPFGQRAEQLAAEQAEKRKLRLVQ